MKTSLRSLGGACGQCQPSLRKVNGVLAATIWVLGIGTLALLSRPPMPGLFFVPFVMWPHAITHLAVLNAKDGKGQCCLFAAQIIYAIWVGTACVAMFSAPAETAPMALLVVAFKAFPALGVLWIAALFCHLRKRRIARLAEARSVT
jgi:hypothetical protein